MGEPFASRRMFSGLTSPCTQPWSVAHWSAWATCWQILMTRVTSALPGFACMIE